MRFKSVMLGGFLVVVIISAAVARSTKPTVSEYFTLPQVQFLSTIETYKLTKDLLSTSFTDEDKQAITTTIPITLRLLREHYPELEHTRDYPWIFGLIDTYTDGSPYVTQGVIVMNAYNLDWDIKDRYQLSKDLLYLRLNIIARAKTVCNADPTEVNVPPWYDGNPPPPTVRDIPAEPGVLDEDARKPYDDPRSKCPHLTTRLKTTMCENI
jgi:hypothetical protein